MSRNLNLDEVKRILAAAKKESQRDALVFMLMAGYGLSVGEIVGTPPRRWDKNNRKWLASDPSLRGILIEDLDKDGILVHRKQGRPAEKIPLNPVLVRELREFSASRTK